MFALSFRNAQESTYNQRYGCVKAFKLLLPKTMRYFQGVLVAGGSGTLAKTQTSVEFLQFAKSTRRPSGPWKSMPSLKKPRAVRIYSQCNKAIMALKWFVNHIKSQGTGRCQFFKWKGKSVSKLAIISSSKKIGNPTLV